jgi:RimJ/RimL family protein N-acetyltransferase
MALPRNSLLLTGEKTDRLRFELVSRKDFEVWLPFFKGEHVAKFLLLNSKLSDKELCQLWFDKALKRYTNKEGGLNALIDIETNKYIGQCGLLVQKIHNKPYIEIGYSILPEFWGMGYATEAAIKCRDYAFEHDLCTHLVSNIHKENVGSQQVAIRNGMKLANKIMNSDHPDFLLYEIHKKDWLRSEN